MTTMPETRINPSPFITTDDGCNLFYRDWGSGPPVVFLHGWGLGCDMWEYQMPWLADRGARCIAYDARGCGRSDDPGYGYDFDRLADDLAAVVERLDLADVTLVAHSMAAGTVARYLTRHGAARIRRVVLVAPTTPYLMKADDNPGGVDRAAFDFTCDQLARDRAAFLAAGAAAFFGAGSEQSPVSPAIVEWGVGLAMRASPRATLAYVRTFSETDLRADLASFTMPTLVIQGDADMSTPLELTGRPTANAIAGSRLTVYEGAAHGLFFTEKERLNRDILEFLSC